MKDMTNARNINGSWYILVRPSFARHLGLEGTAGESAEMEMQDETSKHGNYISAWKTPQKEIEEDNSANKLDSTDYQDTYKKCGIKE